MHTTDRLPVFPLNTVLFTGCRLPLQIFEQRYLTMVKEAMRQNSGFVTALILDGKEVNDAPSIVTTGSYVEIVDWDQLDNGLLGITIECRSRALISDINIKHDGLFTGHIDLIAEPVEQSELVREYHDILDTLKNLAEHPFVKGQAFSVDYNNAVDISNKITQLLPVDNLSKQKILEMNTLDDRFKTINELLQQLQA